jgi:UDPglucose 6-dehydrogenase
MNIAIVGTGYVGLVSGTCLAEMGNQVLCVDNNPDKLEKLKEGIVPIYEPGLEILFERNIHSKRLLFTDDLKQAVLDSEVIFLCLPTPQSDDGSADLQYVLGVGDQIGKILSEAGEHAYKIVVNKSTVPVGTAGLVREAIKAHGTRNFSVVSNPEFLKEGFAVEDFMKPDRIVIGADEPEALEVMERLYQPFVRSGNPILKMDTASSEVTKYAANSYLATRITFMNELANFAEAVGADIDLIRQGMGTDVRIGKRFLFAGIGYGGSCFPKDVNALIKTARENETRLSILNEVDAANQRQKSVLTEKVIKHFDGDLAGRHFAMWGLSFKPNTDDMREAPALTIIKVLREVGATVTAYDPAAMEAAEYYLKDTITYAENDYAALENADALLIVTEWNEFRNPDFDRIKASLKHPVIFDGRNIYAPEKMRERGFTYYSIGRQAVG